MQAHQIINLIRCEATSAARQRLKRLSLKERLPVLHECAAHIATTPENLSFFRDNFAVEIGALLATGYDYAAAEKLYRSAKLPLRVR